MIQVFVFNVLFRFDMFVIFFLSFFLFFFYFLNSTGWVGLLDRLINKQMHIWTVQALQSTAICGQNQNVHIQLRLGDRRSLQSIKYQFGPDLRVFPSVSLICGDDTYCSFLSWIQPRPFKHKWKVAEVMTREDWGGDGNALAVIAEVVVFFFWMSCCVTSSAFWDA